MKRSTLRASTFAGALILAFSLLSGTAYAGDGPFDRNGRTKVGRSGLVYKWKAGC